MSPSLFGADSDHMRHCWLLSSGKNVSHSMSASICNGMTRDCSASVYGPCEDIQAGLHGVAYQPSSSVFLKLYRLESQLSIAKVPTS